MSAKQYLSARKLRRQVSIYLNAKPYKGWSIKGNDCIIKIKNKSIFNKRYTIGMCIDIKGFIDFTITEKALKSIKFNKFTIFFNHPP